MSTNLKRQIEGNIEATYRRLRKLKLTAQIVQNVFKRHEVDLQYFAEMMEDGPCMHTNLAEMLLCYPEHITEQQREGIIEDLTKTSQDMQEQSIRKIRGYGKIGYSQTYWLSIGTPETLLQDVRNIDQLYRNAILANHQPTLEALRDIALALT
jgi:DNA polymerase/3'-5' exonuclease PolX